MLVAQLAGGDARSRSWVRATAEGLTFRPVTGDDLPILKRIYASSRDTEMAVLPWDDAQKAAFLDMQFRAQDSHYKQHYAHMDWLLIETMDRTVGRLYLERDKHEHCVVDIAFLPNDRGRGYGSALIRDLLDECADLGRSMIVYVEKFNPARQLYERLGFRTAEDHGVYDLMRWTQDQPKTAS